MNERWLLEQTPNLDEDAWGGLSDDLRTVRGGIHALLAPPLAVTIHDIVIHDNKKWFGGADIRMDALVVNGHGSPDDPASFYSPQTFRFPGVRDGEQLPTGESGLLVFYGRPAYFLDLFITVSRDRKDSDDLSTALGQQLGSAELRDAFGSLASLVAAPEVLAVKAALGAAAKLGEFAYRILQLATGSTVGLLHTSWLEHRDALGLGRHPEAASYRLRDLSFWYDIIRESPDP
jgi:hypothetical protein